MTSAPAGGSDPLASLSTVGTARRSNALTSAAHRRIRLHLALIPVYLWLAWGWLDLAEHLPIAANGARAQPGRDFIQFFMQGTIARERMLSALYDIDAWAARVPSLVPGVSVARFPPIYGPQVSLLFAPFAALPYTPALLAWMGVTIAVYACCLYAVFTVCPRLREHPFLVMLLAVAAPSLHFALSYGQISAIALACVTVAFFCLRNNRPVLAGFAVGTLFYKPPLGIAAAFVFIAAQEWRIVLGAVAATSAQLLAAALFWGPRALTEYVRSAIRLAPHYAATFEPARFQMHSWRSFFQLLGLPETIATAAYVVVAIATLLAALKCWRSRRPLAVRFSVFLIATVLVDPHLYVYDLIVLVPALLLLSDWVLEQNGVASPIGGLRFEVAAGTLLVACYWAPLLGPVATATRVQVSVLALAALMLIVAGAKPALRNLELFDVEPLNPA